MGTGRPDEDARVRRARPLASGNGQYFEAAQDEVRAPCWFCLEQAQLWETLHQGADCHLAFQTAQRGADAEVRAMAEREMPVVASCDVEALWIGKHQRVA